MPMNTNFMTSSPPMSMINPSVLPATIARAGRGLHHGDAPAAIRFNQEQISKRLPEDFDDLPDEEQQELIAEAEDQVVSYNPSDLRKEVAELGALIRQAKILEDKE